MDMDDFIGLLETLDGLHKLRDHIADYSRAPYGTHHKARLAAIDKAVHILVAQHGMSMAIEKSSGRRYAVIGAAEGGSPVVLTITGDPLIIMSRDDFSAQFDEVSNALNDRIATMTENQRALIGCLMAIAARIDIVNPPKPDDYADDKIAGTVAALIAKIQSLIDERHRFAAIAGRAQTEIHTLKQRVGTPIVTVSFVPCLACTDGMACAMAKGCRLGAAAPNEGESSNGETGA
jgi:hypothetical protein